MPEEKNTKSKDKKKNKTIKENFDAAFKKLGGVEELVNWAKRNTHTRALFYEMYSKMFPENGMKK